MNRWFSGQHGAWAMLLIPAVLGTWLRVQAGVWAGSAALIGCWIFGYLGFVAVAGWVKASPRRKPTFLAPIWTYCLVSGLLGLVTAWEIGLGVLLWIPVYLPLLTGALVLVWFRRERSLASGAVTTAAASLMTVTARFPDATRLDNPGVEPVAWLAVLIFWYFFGTVFYVKTNIRQRGDRGWRIWSAAWHALGLGLTLGLAGIGLVSPWFIALFLVLLIRAVVVPRLGGRGPGFVRRIGFGEVALSAAFLVIALVS